MTSQKPEPPKPYWLRRIHATGVHHRPAVGCELCKALLERLRREGKVNDHGDLA